MRFCRGSGGNRGAPWLFRRAAGPPSLPLSGGRKNGGDQRERPSAREAQSRPDEKGQGAVLKRFRYVLFSRFALPVLYQAFRLYLRTFRLRVENEAPWREHLRQGGTVLLCTWHQLFLPAIGHFKRYAPHHPSLMISRSKDGDIVAYVAGRRGWQTVRGSSSQGGAEALREMTEKLRASRLAGHILDGPKGPAGVVKAGIIRLAHATGAVIVPFYVSADRAWYFRSWDTFLVPKPFARVTLRFGPMIDFNTPDREAAFERQRAHLEAVMRPGLVSA